MHKNALAAVLLVASAGTAGAQDAAQSQNQNNNDPIEGKASLGYISTSGNTDSSTLNAAFNLLWARPRWSHEFDLSAINAETSGTTTAEAYTAAYTARRDFNERSYLFTALNWERDEFSSYEQQLSETAGYGRRFVDTDRHKLNGEIGAGARQADLRDGTAEDEAIVRGALDYEWTFSETASFTQSLAIESGSSNRRTEAVSELRASVIGNIALLLSFRIRNNSDVLPGTEKTDRFTSIALEYAF